MNLDRDRGWHDWIAADRYFDDLAVMAVGPLHPGG